MDRAAKPSSPHFGYKDSVIKIGKKLRARHFRTMLPELRGGHVLPPIALLIACGGCDAAAVNAPAETSRSARAGASNARANPVVATQAKPPRLDDWDARKCGDDEYQNARMERHPRLIGRAPDELEAAFGAASATDRFRVKDAVGTFRGGVGSQLQGGAAANANRTILEKTWTKSGCNFTVRFYEQDGRWRAIDGFEYSVGSDF